MEINKTTQHKLEHDILELADNMAAAAAMFNAHGYTNFIHAREELIQTLSSMFKEEDSLRKSR